jgi:hypothetical protein
MVTEAELIHMAACLVIGVWLGIAISYFVSK